MVMSEHINQVLRYYRKMGHSQFEHLYLGKFSNANNSTEQTKTQKTNQDPSKSQATQEAPSITTTSTPTIKARD